MLLRPTPAIRPSSRLHHRGQLIVETRVHAPVAGQAEVDRGELADAQGA
jgi:hypothetical protein